MQITETEEWAALESYFKDKMAGAKIADLFGNGSSEKGFSEKRSSERGSSENVSPCGGSRFESLSVEYDQLLADFSKQRITPEAIVLLIELAEKAGLSEAIEQLVAGRKVNTTENRAALHTALRLSPEEELLVEGEDVNQAVQTQLQNMSDMIDKLSSGHWRGYSGKVISDVVNLGVGGSDLGPLLVCEALDEFKAAYKNPIKVHFASTMDGSQVSSLFEQLNPETTLFVVVSKSFSTIDTLSNAASAKAWLLNYCHDESIVTHQHFIGISTDENKMTEWGIHPDHQLKLWDWVGGRFSLWSTVGLTIALKIGMENFRLFLKGANALDRHFVSADWQQNMPVWMGLIGVWNSNFCGIGAQAILPYDARLKFFPSYLTQLEMESNGKSVQHDGSKIAFDTCPVLWGEVGPNAQHAFYQLLHQGTRQVACDFIAPVNRSNHSGVDAEADQNRRSKAHDETLHEQHLLTLANCFAQSRALMLGGSSGSGSSDSESDGAAAKLSNHKSYPGNQPSTTLLISELTPYSLGQLIALYEHKVFVMATIWGINPFDQWGVELGKMMAKETLSAVKSQGPTTSFDESTNGLMNFVKGHGE